MSLISDHSKMLKELSSAGCSTVIVRIASVASTYQCTNGSLRLSFQVLDKSGTHASAICYHSNRAVCERFEKEMVVIDFIFTLN